MDLSAYGISVVLPDGWEGRIFVRDVPPDEGIAFPILQAANYVLPIDDGDFGSDATSERMPPFGVFLALAEYGPRYLNAGLFRGTQPDGFSLDDFDPTALQVMVAGHQGLQHFFASAGRSFCLYVVIGAAVVSDADLSELNLILSSLTITKVSSPVG